MDPQLKQRLVGAAVIGLFALIGVPLLLGEPQHREPPGAARETVTPAPVPDSGFSSRIQPLGEAPEQPRVPKPIEVPTAAPPEPVAEATSGLAPPVRPQPRPTSVGQAASAAPESSGGASGAPAGAAQAVPPGQFLVQLASFSGRDNALALRDALRAKGHAASVVTSEDKVHHRLFVGPYADRGAAEKAIAKLKTATGLTGVVRRGDNT